MASMVRAGSARHREPLVLGGHERSPSANQNRRSHGIHRHDLGRQSSMGPGSSPPSDTPPEQPTRINRGLPTSSGCSGRPSMNPGRRSRSANTSCRVIAGCSPTSGRQTSPGRDGGLRRTDRPRHNASATRSATTSRRWAPGLMIRETPCALSGLPEVLHVTVGHPR
jgi:hypothetical protein